MKRLGKIEEVNLWKENIILVCYYYWEANVGKSTLLNKIMGEKL